MKIHLNVAPKALEIIGRFQAGNNDHICMFRVTWASICGMNAGGQSAGVPQVRNNDV